MFEKLLKNKKEQVVEETVEEKEQTVFGKNATTIKDLIAPSGIDASYTNHI